MRRAGRFATWPRPAGVALALGLSFSSTGCALHTAWVQDVGARQVRISDRQEPSTKVQLVQGSGYYLDPERDSPSDAYGPSQPYLLVDVGALNPVLAVGTTDLSAIDHPDMPFEAGKWALQASLPVSFHLFWDAFSDNNPILDTDYTFAGDVAVRASFGDPGELRAGVSWGHISTHVGDEYVIAARREQGGVPFDRVNVSYWPMRFRAGWTWSNAAFDNAPETRWLLSAIGEIERTNRSGSEFFYSLYPGEADPSRVPLVTTRHEPSVTVDYKYFRGESGLGAPAADVSGGDYVRAAVTMARRTVFPYHNGLTEAEGRWAVDAVVGYAFPTRVKLGARQAMVFVRAYRGPNPYGQFRNQERFRHVGIGLAIVP